MDIVELRGAMLPLLPDLRAYARFLARHAGDADDLVQDTVVRALAAADQLQPETSPRAWMFTILRNGFFEQVRRRRSEQSALAHSARAEEVVSGGGERATLPSQQDRIDLDDLSRQLFKLSPLLRDALVLVGAQGFAYDEAALICGVPVGTIKARVSRARTLLAREMADGAARPPTG